jgi:hypothetical protein
VEKLKLQFNPITQRQYEDYQRRLVAVQQADDFDTMPVAEFNRLIIEIAGTAQIIQPWTADALLDSTPGQVRAATLEILTAIQEALAPPSKK